MAMFIMQDLLNIPSIVLYSSKNWLKTCEQSTILLDPWIPKQGAQLTAVLPFYSMRRLPYHSNGTKIHLDAALTIPKPQLLMKICSIANLSDNNIRKFDAKNRIFFPRMLRLCKSLGKIDFLWEQKYLRLNFSWKSKALNLRQPKLSDSYNPFPTPHIIKEGVKFSKF